MLNVTNYRPITKLSTILNLFELFLTKHLFWHYRNIIIDQQHGFSSGKSTLTNLMIYQNNILEYLESGLKVNSFYTDFSEVKQWIKLIINYLYSISKISNFQNGF